MNTYNITTGEIRDILPKLECGDRVLLSGTVYTARDAAHKEIFALLDAGEKLPFEIENAIIYYAGPTPGGEGRATGSCGPTTSSRMDGFAPRLYRKGLAATIGKGERSTDVIEAITETSGVYFCAVGGAGALISKHILEAEEIAFLHLGCESVKKLEVDKLPLTVAIDSKGNDIFTSAKEKYRTV